MTEKHRLAISRGIRKLRKRRRLSAAMIASWKRRRTEASPQQSAPEVRNNNNAPQQLIEALTQLAKAKQRCRELLSKLEL